MGNNGEVVLTEKEQAIADQKVCAQCKFHFPGHAPLQLLYAPPPTRIMRGAESPQPLVIHAFQCGNVHSDMFGVILSLHGSCKKFESPSVLEVPATKKVEKKLKDNAE